MHVSQDNAVATLDIQGDYRAEEVERLIQELSLLRGQMSPPVPMSPGATPREDPAAARAGGDPCVQVAVMRDGMTRFWVRHEGLGWFGFNLPVDRARTLAQYILGLAMPREQAQEFFEQKRRTTDRSH
jgi:hypothetical protein